MNTDSKSLIWLSCVTDWCLVSTAWVCPDWSGSERQQCPAKEVPPLAANTDFYTVTWAVRAHDTALHSAIRMHTLVLTLVVGVQLWTPTSQSRSFRANWSRELTCWSTCADQLPECQRPDLFAVKESVSVQNLCEQVRNKQKSVLFPSLVRNDNNWTIFLKHCQKVNCPVRERKK